MSAHSPTDGQTSDLGSRVVIVAPRILSWTSRPTRAMSRLLFGLTRPSGLWPGRWLRHHDRRDCVRGTPLRAGGRWAVVGYLRRSQAGADPGREFWGRRDVERRRRLARGR